MAELATAGSVVGLISLSIQSCQGLTSYYSAWKSYDEQIGHTHRNLDELRITCENLERELQRITQYQEPAVQQVVRLIASCQDGINSLRHTLEQCHTIQIPDTLTAKIKLYRGRALFPFRKQTLQSLKDTVHSIQGNLSSALQILQLHVSTEQEQRLAVLAMIASGTETAVHSNQTAIQALSSPLQAINQAFPLMQQQNDATAITLRAVHQEAHDSRQEARHFQEKLFTELTKLADREDSSPGRIERSMITSLNHHSAGMSQLKRDLQYAHSQDTNEVVAKLEAIDRSINGLQICLISKPSLMQSVCEANDRLENLPGAINEQGEGRLASRDSGRQRNQRCSCKPKYNTEYTTYSPRNSYFRIASKPRWKFMFETESMSHHPTCHLFVSSCSTIVAKFRIKRCGAFLAGAIEASISIATGAGGFSINPGLRCVRVVPASNLAFELLHRLRNKFDTGPEINICEVESSLETSIQDLARLFRDGKASPYDVDLEGNTLLHVASTFPRWFMPAGGTANKFFELVVRFFKSLEELCVPLNWTNDLNLTFMNYVVGEMHHTWDICNVVTPMILLLDTGAEFANLSISQGYQYNWPFLPLYMTVLANNAGFVYFLEDNELSIAIWHRSEQKLDEVLRESPHLINEINGLANTPLHLAAGWPYGIRTLLQHGACLNTTDQGGWTPLYYAIELGFSETVSVLMKADCSLILGRWAIHDDLLEHATSAFLKVHPDRWSVSQEARTEVLDTVISSLAERRHNLQTRLAALSIAAKINPGVFQDDRILDEYAQYAECVEEDAMRVDDDMPRYASSLLPDRRTVYHVSHLTVEVAEKLWQIGFRDIDVPNEQGLTPLMCRRFSNLIDALDVSSWLIQKGAKLHRLQHRTQDYDADPTTRAMELPLVNSALHHVAYNIGDSATYLAKREQSGHAKRLQIELHRLCKEARLLAGIVLLDVSCDDCVCACSLQGCLASTMMLKSFEKNFFLASSRRKWFVLATEYLIDLVGSSDSCPDWLAKELIRYQTFKELELRHTCCKGNYSLGLIPCDAEEQAEIQDEDHEKIEILESLLEEFEEHRGNQDVLSFLKGYWAMRMDQVHREQGHVDKEALREIGVVLHKDSVEEVDGDLSDERGIYFRVK